MDTARDALLRAMLDWEWADECDGDIESPTGYFGYLVVERDEIPAILDEFADVLAPYEGLDPESIVGVTVAWVDSDGMLHAMSQPSRRDAERWFRERQREFLDWWLAC